MHIPLIDDAFATLLILPLIDSGIRSAINGANSAFRVGFTIGPGGSEVKRHILLSNQLNHLQVFKAYHLKIY